MSNTDAELVARFQAGDEAAFAAIYQRYAPRLRRYIQRRVGRWEDAEDLVQEAMLKAARYIPHGTMYDLDGYLLLCVRQQWWLRAEQARRRPEEWPFDPHGVYAGHVGFVEDRVVERETVAEAIALLGHLPDEDRPVALLKVIAGYDLPGAAVALGRSVSSARAAWRRCSRRFERWGGGKAHYAALDQALRIAVYDDAVPVESQCLVPGCGWPRHAYGRCAYHAEGLLARRRQLAAQRKH